MASPVATCETCEHFTGYPTNYRWCNLKANWYHKNHHCDQYEANDDVRLEEFMEGIDEDRARKLYHP